MVLPFVFVNFTTFSEWSKLIFINPYKTCIRSLCFKKKDIKETNHLETHVSPTEITHNKKVFNLHSERGIGYPTFFYFDDLAWLLTLDLVEVLILEFVQGNRSIKLWDNQTPTYQLGYPWLPMNAPTRWIWLVFTK